MWTITNLHRVVSSANHNTHTLNDSASTQQRRRSNWTLGALLLMCAPCRASLTRWAAELKWQHTLHTSNKRHASTRDDIVGRVRAPNGAALAFPSPRTQRIVNYKRNQRPATAQRAQQHYWRDPHTHTARLMAENMCTHMAREPRGYRYPISQHTHTHSNTNIRIPNWYVCPHAQADADVWINTVHTNWCAVRPLCWLCIDVLLVCKCDALTLVCVCVFIRATPNGSGIFS